MQGNQSRAHITKCLTQLTQIQNQIQTKSGNQNLQFKYAIGKDDPHRPTQYLLKIFKNVHVNERVIERLNEIKSTLPHDYISKVVSTGYSKLESKAYVLYEYFYESEPLQKLLDNKKDLLTKGYLNSIFYQVITAMQFLQTNKINHLRLNPSSILVKLPDSKLSPLQIAPIPVVQICDFGIAMEQEYFYKFCLSRQFFDNQQKNSIFEESFQARRKYDFWALGCIMYYSYQQTEPFFGKTGFFNNERIFKNKYLDNPEEWIEQKSENKIVGKELWQGFLQRCWGIKGKQQFKSWKQARQFFLQKHSISQIEKIPISDLFSKHTSLMFLFSNIYIMLREQLQYKLIQKLRGEESSKAIDILSLRLFHLMFHYHMFEFKKHLFNRCSILPFGKRQVLAKFDQYILTQKKFLVQKRMMKEEQPSITKILDQMINSITKFKILIGQRSDNNTKLSLLYDFCEQLENKVKIVIEAKKDAHTNESESLNIMYGSGIFDNKVRQLGFQLPSLPLISS